MGANDNTLPIRTNADRADLGLVALRAYHGELVYPPGNLPGDLLADLLADLMHLARATPGVSFWEALNAAQDEFHREVHTEPEGGPTDPLPIPAAA